MYTVDGSIHEKGITLKRLYLFNILLRLHLEAIAHCRFSPAHAHWASWALRILSLRVKSAAVHVECVWCCVELCQNEHRNPRCWG